MTWLLDHAEVTSAGLDFVWTYWTDVSNWEDPPARFTLDGPFASGSRGTTVTRGQKPVGWVLRDVTPRESYTMETELEGACLLCRWSFEETPEGGTTLRQQIGLSGPDAQRHASGIREAFGATLPDGMKRIARILSARSTRS